MTVREPAVAGQFYTADPVELAREVNQYLASGRRQVGVQPAGVIVPHAGHMYSGPVAATPTARCARRTGLCWQVPRTSSRWLGSRLRPARRGALRSVMWRSTGK